MKQPIITLLITAFCLSGFATVKPRYMGWNTGFWSQAYPEPNHIQMVNGPHRVGLISSAPLKSFGSPKVPVILVQFQDLKFISGLAEGDSCVTTEQQEIVNDYFDIFCNGLRDGGYYTDHGSAGAIAEYFRDQSEGLFTPEFVVIGPITLDNGYATYGKNEKYRDSNVSAFFKESLQKAINAFRDWSVFDNNNNGTIDMAFFIYAGEGENGSSDPNTIWPNERPSGATIDSVKFACYACCNETYHRKTDGIGVFVHELSHALGLPDLYDKGLLAYGMDYWDIMDSGNYCNSGCCPCGYSAYEKDFMGWKSLITLDNTEAVHIVLKPMHAGGVGYKMVNPDNPDEYYVIENRQNEEWDTYIGCINTNKAHGMVLTHIDYVQSSWTGNSVNSTIEHQRCTIVPADGHLDSYMFVTTMDQYNEYMASTAGDPFPGYYNITSCEATKPTIMHYEEKETSEMTTCELPAVYTGAMNQALLNIVENEDGTVEFDYCPNGLRPTAISTVADDTPVVTVYNLAGMPVGSTHISNGKAYLHNLPSGIYIVNGQKIIVQ